MELALKQIKTNLKPIAKSDNLKYKHLNNEFQEIIEYSDYYTLNRRKHYLVMRFIHQKRENVLSFNYRFVYNAKNVILDESYSFMDKDKVILPGINPIDRQRLFDLYKLSLIDNRIVNEISLDEQYKTLNEIFMNSYKNIIEYGKNLPKINKIPD